MSIESPDKKRPLLELTEAELSTFFVGCGEKPFRAKQLHEWIYRKYTLDFAKMSNLGKALREKLETAFMPTSTTITARQASEDGTVKLLLKLADAETIEMVLIPSPNRMTFCLSTQVGCPVRCRFCASGQHGLIRNLTKAEILEEVFRGIAEIGKLPDNIVFMGIGEGLTNLSNLLPAIDVITSPNGLGMSPRRLTVSTSGIVPGIRKLADYGKELTLAISLHATDEGMRAKLIPEAMRYPIKEILQAADEYSERIGRMVTFEYAIIAGINDSPAAAKALAEIARKHHAKINLIPYNETMSGFQRPSQSVIQRFSEILEKEKVAMTLRLEKGADVTAACGPLRSRYSHK